MRYFITNEKDRVAGPYHLGNLEEETKVEPNNNNIQREDCNSTSRKRKWDDAKIVEEDDDSPTTWYPVPEILRKGFDKPKYYYVDD